MRNKKGQFIKGNKEGFKKGNKLWDNNNSKKTRFTKESKAFANRFHTEKTKNIIRLKKLGVPNSSSTKFKKGQIPVNWKGDDVGYDGLHQWVNRHLGKPGTCEHCGRTGLWGRQINWANKDHGYKRNLKDWLRLCVKCHKKYDKERKFKKTIF